MKLFLSSISIMGDLTQPFIDLVGKPLNEIAFCLIENAADPYQDSEKQFMYKTRMDFESLGMRLQRLDLQEYRNNPNQLKVDLSRFDVVWIGGGNTFYVRWLMREVGFDPIIRDLVDNGIVYGGGSAGAIVASPDISLAGWDPLWDANDVGLTEFSGLGLVPFVVCPHYTEAELPIIERGVSRYGYPLVAITDEQAIVVNGMTVQIVGPGVYKSFNGFTLS